MKQPVEILLVEDNPGDVRLTVEALRESQLPCHLSVVGDAEKALRRIRAPQSPERRPDLVLLDLELPRRNGLELLADLKQDENLRAIPVVVLTSSRDERDVLRAYDLHANCYVTKPVDPEDLVAVLRALEDFWVSVARLPRGD